MKTKVKAKKEKINKGIAYSAISREFGLSFKTVLSLVNQGELKLNDYDKIDEEYYLKFKEKWRDKPEWMKKKTK